MKTKLLLALIILLSLQTIKANNSDKVKKRDTLIFFADKLLTEDTRSLSNKEYIVIIKKRIDDEANYSISMNESFSEAEAINTSKRIDVSSNEDIVLAKYVILIKNRSKIEIVITRTIDEVIDETIKKTITKRKDQEDEVELETTIEKIKKKTIHKITLNGIKKWKWKTTIGISAVGLYNSDTYKTIKTDDIFKVVEDGSQKLIDPIPLMMFTYMNTERPSHIAPSAGIGFNSEDISIFAGASVYVGYNIVLTGGIALHKQLRLDNQYNVGQTLPAAIDADSLNTNYFRFNPFVALTFNLTKNPFAPQTNQEESTD